MDRRGSSDEGLVLAHWRWDNDFIFVIPFLAWPHLMLMSRRRLEAPFVKDQREYVVVSHAFVHLFLLECEKVFAFWYRERRRWAQRLCYVHVLSSLEMFGIWMWLSVPAFTARELDCHGARSNCDERIFLVVSRKYSNPIMYSRVVPTYFWYALVRPQRISHPCPRRWFFSVLVN